MDFQTPRKDELNINFFQDQVLMLPAAVNLRSVKPGMNRETSVSIFKLEYASF